MKHLQPHELWEEIAGSSPEETAEPSPPEPETPLSSSAEEDHLAVAESSETPAVVASAALTKDFVLDTAQPLPADTFPNQPRVGSTQVPTTIPNVIALLKGYGISVRYDVIKKKLLISVPGLVCSPDNFDNAAFAHVESLAILNGMSTGKLPSFIETIGDRNLYNPAADWILSKPWDGIDRLQSICDTIVANADFSQSLKEILIKKWLLSVVAAALKGRGFTNRGVLTLQGEQGIGKTSWFRRLINDQVLQERLIKVGHHMDAGDKDAQLTAITHWIVEIGELDSSFKKDIARLKGFLTNDSDKVRRPYGRTDSEYPRRTVFCASVNDYNFLVDTTGNTRFWVIPVEEVNYTHNIDMQQVFAQLAVEFNNGMEWWLTKEEEMSLEYYNKRHRAVNVIEEKILSIIDQTNAVENKMKSFSATELLKEIGIENPTNRQCKECALILRSLYGASKRIHGIEKWRIQLR